MSEHTYRLSIKGMHCRSCELLIEEHLKELSHVKRVDVDHSTGEAVIHYQGERPSDDALRAAVIKAGYETGVEEEKSLINLNPDNIRELIVGIGVLFLLYIIAKGFGLTDINLNPDVNEPSFGLVLMIGLVAGVSTCMALVGGLVLGLSSKFAEKHPTADGMEKFRPHLFFVGGRILGYAFFGGVLGLVGSVFQLSSSMNATLTLLVGALMLFIGLQLTELFPRLSKMSFSLPPSIAKLVGANKHHKEYSHKHSMILGAMTFFLPCGFTQAMQVYAVSRGNFFEGALIMGLFALGTAPGLLGIGGLTATVKGSFKSLFFKTAGVAIVLMSLFNMSNGYNLLKASLAFSDGTEVATTDGATDSADPNVTIEDGVQVVQMVESGRGYTPNKFTIKKGIPVKLVIDGQAPYSCAAAFTIPKFRIQKFLQKGENVIEFTPKEIGRIPFSCSMGMYTGVFNVVEGDGAVADSDSSDSSDSADTTDSQQADNSANPNVVTGGATCGGGSGGGCGGCGGGANIQKNDTVTEAKKDGEVQVIKSTYTSAEDVQPNNFTVKVGQPVRYEVDVKDDGSGCMSTIKVQGLYETPQFLRAGETLVMEFTPTEPGEYNIACAMNVPRGTITVK